MFNGVTMSPVVLVIGGCRSGKSGFALDIAEKISCSDRCFIATSLPLDNEMKDRIAATLKTRSWFSSCRPRLDQEGRGVRMETSRDENTSGERWAGMLARAVIDANPRTSCCVR